METKTVTLPKRPVWYTVHLAPAVTGYGLCYRFECTTCGYTIDRPSGEGFDPPSGCYACFDRAKATAIPKSIVDRRDTYLADAIDAAFAGLPGLPSTQTPKADRFAVLDLNEHTEWQGRLTFASKDGEDFGTAADMVTEIRKLREVAGLVPDLLEELRKVEWAGRHTEYPAPDCPEDYPACPSCEGLQPCNAARTLASYKGSGVGHYDSCALAAAIAKAEGRAS
jgi:hypothetical protein